MYICKFVCEHLLVLEMSIFARVWVYPSMCWHVYVYR